MRKFVNSGCSVVPFVKMHGAGNDYVYIDGVNAPLPEDASNLARDIADRHFGVGGDGMVAIMKSDVADFRMRMWNADGSEAQMCGNASRCVGKFVHDLGLTDKTVVTLETLAGIKVLHLHLDDEGLVESVTVDMGEPIPAETLTDKVVIDSHEFTLTRVSMGNPHAVIFNEPVNDEMVLGYGPKLEVDPLFPEKSNIEFAHVTSRGDIDMRVWERGTGETLACGTGSCATAVAAVLNGLTERKVTLHLIGGCLDIEWRDEDNHVYMTGPATFVAEGEYFRNR